MTATQRFMDVQREVIERFDRGELDQKAAQLEIEHFWAGALRRAVIDGDVENGSLMAGQSVGMVTREQTDAPRSSSELVEQALRRPAGSPGERADRGSRQPMTRARPGRRRRSRLPARSGCAT